MPILFPWSFLLQFSCDTCHQLKGGFYFGNRGWLKTGIPIHERWYSQIQSNLFNVGKAIINHPQFHHFYRWYKPSQSWVVYGMVLSRCKFHWLVVSTPLKKYERRLGLLFPTHGKYKKLGFNMKFTSKTYGFLGFYGVNPTTNHQLPGVERSFGAGTWDPLKRAARGAVTWLPQKMTCRRMMTDVPR